MSQQIEFGLRLKVDTSEGGKLVVVTDGLKSISAAADSTGKSLDAIAAGIQQLNNTTSRIAESLGGVADGHRQVTAASNEAAAATKKFSETEEQATARIREMVAASLASQAALAGVANTADNAAGAQENYNAAVWRGRGAAEASAAAMASSQATLAAQSAQMYRHTGAVDAHSVAVAKTAADVAKLIDKYDPLGVKLRELQADFAALNKASQRGAVGDQDDARVDLAYQRLQREIKATEAAMAGANPGLRNASENMASLGMSSRATAFAMRQVPMQFTDIAVSLAAGQNPMMVMLQQGGQLKDMFGGVGPAARAMGGYIMGLVNPLTVGAVAIGVLALAYEQGRGESEKMANALIMTGNAAGTTVSQIQTAAAATVAATGATKGAAADALTQIAGTGKVAAENMATVSTAAVAMERATGQSVAASVKEFESLGKSPVEASERLNAQYHYLTASVYEQIKALADQGQADDAAALAQETYAAAMLSRSKKIEENLGSLERGWRGVKDVAKEAWNAMLDIGREDSLDAKLKKAKEDLAAGGGMFGGETEARAKVAALQAQLDAQNALAKSQDEGNKQAEAGIEWAKQGDKYRSKQQILEQDIARARQVGLQAGKSEAEIAERINQIREKSAGQGPAPDNSYINQYNQLAEALNKYIPQLESERAGTAALTEGQKLALEIKRKLTAADQAALAPALERVRVGELALEQSKAMARAADEYYRAEQQRADSLVKSSVAMQADAEQIRVHTQELGLSTTALADLRISRIDDQLALKEHELAELDAKGQCTAYTEALRDNIAALRDRRSALQAQAVKQTGVDEAKKAEEAWKKTSEDINRSLTDSIMKGGKSGGEYLKDYFRTLVLRPTISGLMQPVSGMVSNAIGQVMGTSSGQQGGNAGSLLNAGVGIYNGGPAAAMSAGATSFATSSVGQAMGLSEVTGTYIANAELATEAVVANTVSLTETGTTLASFAGTIGTAMPYIAAAIAIYSMFASKGGGPKDTGGATIDLTSSSYSKAWDPNPNVGMDKTLEALSGDIHKYAALLGGTTSGLRTSLSYQADPQGDASSSVYSRVENAQGQQVYSVVGKDVGRDQNALNAELQLEAKRLLLVSLQNSNMPREVAAVLSTVDAAGATSAQIDRVLALAQTFRSLGSILPDIAGMSDDNIKALAKGVSENFNNEVATYYNTFFSATERDIAGKAAAQKEVDDTFAKLGMAVPASNDQLKAMIAGLDRTTESGIAATETLMKVSSTFDLIQKATANLINNAVSSYINNQAANGNAGLAQIAASNVASINNDLSQNRLATALGTDRQTLERTISAAGGNLGEIAGKYWSVMTDTQKAAVTEALNSSTAYIQAVKAQWDTQQQIVQSAYNNVAKLKDFGRTLDADVAGLRINAGQLDQGQYISSQIAEQQAALDTLYSGGARPDELLDTANKLRDLTMQRYSLEADKIKEISKFAVQVGDYLKGLKIGDLSPLTMGQKLTEAGAQLNDVLLALESGTEAQKSAARSKLTNNADSYLKLAQQYDPSSYATIFAEVQKAITPYADVGTVAEQQLAQQQAIAAKAQATIEQLQGLRTQAGSWQATAQVKLDSALASLAPLSAKLDQLGAGGAIATAIRDLPNALATAINAGRTSNIAGGSTAATVSTAPTPAIKTYPTGSAATGGLGGSALLASIDGSEASVVTVLTRARAAGMSPADIAALWNDAHPENKLSTEDLTAWAKARNVPGFDVGIDDVPYDMPAVIHKGERVFPAADNRRLFEILDGGNAGTPAIVQLLSQLIARVDHLAEQNAQLTEMLASVLSRATEDAAEQVATAIERAANPRQPRAQELLS